MPTTPLPAALITLLKQPNPAVMATIALDGRPVTVATWYLLEDDGRILLGFDSGRARLQHLRSDPRLSLTALAMGNWYTQVSIQGRVGPIVDDVGLKEIDRLALHYTGQPYKDRERARVATRVEIERWHGWSASHVIEDQSA
jgi:PPOX class probable F420-dependent enzyme